MVFALLIAAIIWNLGTWYFGLPASSSHTLVGSIIGVGVANALMRGRDGTSGVDWSKATEIGYALLLSPLVGFIFAALLLLLLKVIVRNPALYAAPEGNKGAAAVDPRSPDPDLHRRQLCAWLERRPEGHGPDHADPDRHRADGLRVESRLPESQVAQFQKTSAAASTVIAAKGAGHGIIGDPRPAVTQYVAQHTLSEGTYSLACGSGEERRRPGAEIRLVQQGSGGSGRQHP